MFVSGATDSLVRSVIDALLEYSASQLIQPNVPIVVANGTSTGTSGDKNKEKFKGTPSTYIDLVIPDTSDRRDVAGIVDAIFEFQNYQLLKCSYIKAVYHVHLEQYLQFVQW